MYNAVGGSTIHWSAHFPRFHPSDFRVRTLDGVADDWPIDYATLEPYFDLNDRMMGVAGIAGDPAYPPKPAPPPPSRWARWARPSRAASTRWAGTGGRRTARSSRATTTAARLRQPAGPASSAARRAPRRAPTSPTGRRRSRRGARLADALPRARDHASDRTACADGVVYYDARRRGARAEGAAVVVAAERHRHAAAPAQLALGALPRRARQSQRARRQEPDVPSRTRWCAASSTEPLDGHRGPIGCCIISQEFYETDLVARLRARLLVPGAARARAVGPRPRGSMRRAACPGAPATTRRTPTRFDRTAGVAVIVRGPARAAQPRRRSIPSSTDGERHPGAAASPTA